MSQPILAVSEIFGPTFQGEGPSAGQRAAFLRLTGCNLACTWCDTPYTWDIRRYELARETERLPVDVVLERLRPIRASLLVVTGGEPLLQQERLVPVLTACRRDGCAIEVETNGTALPGPDLVRLVDRFNVSPKLANSGVSRAMRIRPDALAAFRVTGRAVYKFVVQGAGDLEEVGKLAAEHRLGPICHARCPRAARAGVS
jgi:7-carboxy-7-deazaguanine synthase